MRVRVVDAAGSAPKKSSDENPLAGLAHRPPAPDPRAPK
jgi:hypothetical protein